MGWQWSADPGSWYADHLTGRCGCTDERPWCEVGRALWQLAVSPRTPKVEWVRHDN